VFHFYQAHTAVQAQFCSWPLLKIILCGGRKWWGWASLVCIEVFWVSL